MTSGAPKTQRPSRPLTSTCARLLWPVALGSALVWIAAAGSVRAAGDVVASFYANRQVKFVIGSAGGGGYDFYSRLVGRFMSRHLPGAPVFVMQNMPGAAGVLAADYLFVEAHRDGSEIGMVGRAAATLPLLDPHNPAPKYDATKFNWIGTPQQEVGLILAKGSLPILTPRDLTTHELVVSGTSKDSPPSFYPRLLNALLGTKFRVVDGYKGSQDALLALDRGEVSGHVSGSSAAPLRAQIAPAVRDGKLRIVAQIGLAKDPALADVPLISDLAKTDLDREALQLVLMQQAMAWPIVAPPGVPPERVKALRIAFDATMKDPDFLAEAANEKLGVSPLGGAQIEALIDSAYKAPAQALARVRAVSETQQ
jgi:tripartite-type tricarboxylate transporter receptor subunit TctC